MTKSKFDPLEEAKITDDKSASKEEKGGFFSRKKKKKKVEDAPEAEAEAPEAPAPAPAPAAAAPPPPPPPPATEEEVPPPPADTALMTARMGVSYRVLEEKNVSINGRMTALVKGKVLNARFYGGLLSMQRILDSGVKVEEC